MNYVYMVYKERSFSRAAEKLYITQPALSMAIKKVEDELGMPIFDRMARPISLTPAGEAYIEYIRQTIYLEQDLNHQIEDIRLVNTGSICLGGSHYLNAYILPPILAAFMEQYPNVTIDIQEASSARLSEMLSNRELDLTFNCNPRFMEGFERYPAFTDHIFLAVPKSQDDSERARKRALSSFDICEGAHLKENCPTVPLEEFSNLDFIILNRGNNLYDRAKQLFEEAGIKPNIRMKLSQLVTAYHLADAGIGVTFVSDRLITPTYDKLNYYKLNSELAERQFYMLLPKRNYTTIVVKTFIRFFMNEINRNK